MARLLQPLTMLSACLEHEGRDFQKVMAACLAEAHSATLFNVHAQPRAYTVAVNHQPHMYPL